MTGTEKVLKELRQIRAIVSRIRPCVPSAKRAAQRKRQRLAIPVSYIPGMHECKNCFHQEHRHLWWGRKCDIPSCSCPGYKAK